MRQFLAGQSFILKDIVIGISALFINGMRSRKRKRFPQETPSFIQTEMIFPALAFMLPAQLQNRRSDTKGAAGEEGKRSDRLFSLGYTTPICY